MVKLIYNLKTIFKKKKKKVVINRLEAVLERLLMMQQKRLLMKLFRVALKDQFSTVAVKGSLKL